LAIALAITVAVVRSVATIAIPGIFVVELDRRRRGWRGVAERRQQQQAEDRQRGEDGGEGDLHRHARIVPGVREASIGPRLEISHLLRAFSSAPHRALSGARHLGFIRANPDITIAPRGQSPEQSHWGFAEEDEITPGRTAIKLLGGGFRFEAYLAWDERLRSLVVVKVVRPGLVEDPGTLRGLSAEVEMLERLRHPVLVRSFGSEIGGQRPHVVLEHLEGPRLSSLLRRYGPLPVEQLVPLAIQLCSAAHYLALERVAHLDIKPSNIIMAGPPRLIDLSVARSHEDCRDLHSAVGTDAYMSPEQCAPHGPLPPGPASDVWGIGVTLFRAVAGQPAFRQGARDAPAPRDRWPQLVDAPHPLPDHVGPAVSRPILACLERDPAARPSAGEVADDLERVLDALPKPRLSRLKPRVQR
jgi:serine/threonine-protein kinase